MYSPSPPLVVPNVIISWMYVNNVGYITFPIKQQQQSCERRRSDFPIQRHAPLLFFCFVKIIYSSYSRLGEQKHKYRLYLSGQKLKLAWHACVELSQ